MKKKSMPSQADLAQILRYDADTGALYWLARPVDAFSPGRQTAEQNAAIWNGRYAGKEAFTSKNARGYRRGTICGSHYLAHRIIWKLVTGCEPDEIDHQNGNTSDNRLSNLRAVSRSENFKNRKVNRNNSSGVLGVRRTRRDKWKAYAWDGERQVSLGEFDNIDDASVARKDWERRNGYHQNHGRV